jgi:hypothetical protein
MMGHISRLINVAKHFLDIRFKLHIFKGEAIDVTLYALVFLLLHDVFPLFFFRESLCELSIFPGGGFFSN